MDSGKNSDNNFSMDTKAPQSDIDPAQTKVATKTLLALGALLHLCYCCLASGPDPPSPPHGTARVLVAL